MTLRFTTPEMAAVWSPEAHLRQMLRFEAALARAEADVGVVPAEAARAIEAACGGAWLDAEDVARQAAAAGTPAIPLVRALAERVGGDAGGFVHWGATSQDAIDTAMVLQAHDGLRLLDADLRRLAAACAALADAHRRTLMPGRTLLQHAVPITFGLKAARWLALVMRQRRALAECRDRCLALQLGGAAGTLAALGERGLEVAERVGARLGLPVPALPWHAERDRVATVAATLGVVAGAMAKVAGDVVLMAQSEVGEAAEGAAPGKGGSSAMPQKRNPVDAMTAIAAARLAIGAVPVVLGGMQQEHERALGGWQAEWEALPDAFRYAAGAVAAVARAVAGLEVDAARMRANLDVGGGALMAESLSMALAAHVGRPEAQRRVEAAVARAGAEGVSMREAALADVGIRGVLSQDGIERALDPAGYLGATDALIGRALEGWREAEHALPYHWGAPPETHDSADAAKGRHPSIPAMTRSAPIAIVPPTPPSAPAPPSPPPPPVPAPLPPPALPPTLLLGATRLAYRVDGPPDAPPLIFVNSLGADLRMWDAQARSLAGRFRVVRYDARGHGGSDVSLEPVTLDRLGADLVALLDALGIERADVCGLSLGGLTAMWLAARHPGRVRRAVLANTAARIGSDESWSARIAGVRAGGMAGVVDAIVGRFLSGPFRAANPEATRAVEAMVLGTDPAGYVAASEALRAADLRAEVPSIRVRCLVVGSELDVSTPPSQAEELHAMIPGSELVILSRTAHLSSVERAVELTGHLQRFLSQP